MGLCNNGSIDEDADALDRQGATLKAREQFPVEASKS